MKTNYGYYEGATAAFRDDIGAWRGGEIIEVNADTTHIVGQDVNAVVPTKDVYLLTPLNQQVQDNAIRLQGGCYA